MKKKIREAIGEGRLSASDEQEKDYPVKEAIGEGRLQASDE